jgi:uncharacterized protein YkwD
LVVAPGRRQVRAARVAALAAIAATALFAPGAVPTAAADACNEHGNKLPEELTVEQAQKAVHCLINKERGNNLGRDRRLGKAAQYHSRYMRNHTCFSHVCAGEKDVLGRLRKFNYIVGGLSFWMYGENIAYGLRSDGTPRNIVQGWMRSPGHRANILNNRFRYLGVGFMHGTPNNPDAPGGIYTTDFGVRRG